ncbi:hypothetical protein [Endozoicomonas sp. 4G]|uniref:hypothetical protein n=1 Tax=Endozoicomonas sp. 4G TaxID=2872754 RepID=UPI0020791497|nr:hypothetical protein [Endozoicomonas sp. 4G]
MKNLEENGHSAFHLCTDTVDIKELKRRIDLNAKDRNINLPDIKGINIFGPVISSKTVDYLKPKDLFFYPTTALTVDNIDLILWRSSTLIDIKTEPYNSPYIERWVSHMFASPGDINTDISTALYDFASNTVQHKNISVGENFKNKLKNDLSDSRTIDYYSFSYPYYGEGTALLGMASFPVLYVITGLARVREGYSFWDRRQTPGDKIGTPILYGLMSVLEAYAIFSYLYTQHYLPHDNKWKRVLLRKPLTVDGLLDPSTEL